MLRMEDIDVWRNKPDAAAQALDDLRWLGLDWDGEAVVQSTRLPEHEAAIAELQRVELVYPCTCSRNDIVSAASAPHSEHEGPTYPGTCAYRTVADAATLDRPYSWRFRATHTPTYFDLVQGPMELDLKQLGGDFVVWRSAKVPAYQLAVVVDDAAAVITEVVRGDDLVPSTPRQLLIYEALGLAQPRFAHVPLVVGENGRRLAKRHGDTRLSSLRDAGVKAEALLGLLAWSCGWLPNPEPISAKELVAGFTWDAIPKQPFVLKMELLEGIGFRT